MKYLTVIASIITITITLTIAAPVEDDPDTLEKRQLVDALNGIPANGNDQGNEVKMVDKRPISVVSSMEPAFHVHI